MKHSIKRQMAACFIGVMAVTLICCWLVNRFFLENYYIENKKHVILNAYHVLNNGVSEGRLEESEFITELDQICATDNISLFVMDTSGNPRLYSNRDYKTLQRRLYAYIFELETPETARVLVQGEGYVIRESKDFLTQADYLELIGTLDSGEPFIMRTAVESIRESAELSSRFFAYIGAAGILVSSLLIWWLSRRLSQPMMELAELSQRMADLDFNAKFVSHQNNEIGFLGQHMNQLSETLEQTISELKTANNELQKDIEHKTQIDEMRKDFLSNVSHELKTPIALIQGYAEGLKECINDDPESRDFYCEVIMDEAGKMNTMVKNLLALNQLEFGNDITSMERFDIADLVQNVLNSVGILMEQKGIHLIFKADEPLYVWADEFKVEQVVTNYVSNAINHCDYDKIIEVKLVRNGGSVRVSVFNTGNPIPENDLDKIWIKFYKVDKARTREYGGSGIGLSIVKAVMESMNKEYGVKNYDNGVEFWFEVDGKVN
ncbi:MAG: HAMP domain-containing protein [Lachnospiraceae bacterium]|jgi:two-component system sensor histidine kinase VanS|nr:HAMP domain-containing protein [Lachnospiraceae bacterium]